MHHTKSWRVSPDAKTSLRVNCDGAAGLSRGEEGEEDPYIIAVVILLMEKVDAKYDKCRQRNGKVHLRISNVVM